MCELPDGIVNSEVNDLKERNEEYIGNALEYACRSWYKHLIGKMSARTVKILDQFLREKFIFWLEVLSVTGAVWHAVVALEAIVKWLDVRYIFLVCPFQKSIKMCLGLANSRSRQGLLSFRTHILPPHQYLRTTHLYFCASLIPRKLYGP